VSKKAIILYLHAHQPYRIRDYSIFDAAQTHNYFETDSGKDNSNQKVLKKVSAKSYLPTNEKLINLLQKYPEFKVNLSITGVLLWQLENWAPEVLQSFKDLVATGKVEIVAETFYHSLAFFYDREEFERQVNMHRDKIKEIFDQEPKILRNTELAYNNELAQWAEAAGYKGILAEGWDAVLGWRSSNFMYRPKGTKDIKLLLKNYKLSDDIAFRFGDQEWSEWPLTADKFTNWLNETRPADIFNLFMDYETFGEHQWEDKGIFDFLDDLPEKWLSKNGNTFMSLSEAVETYEVNDEIDMPFTVTWADTERDLTAWLGNAMQQQAITSLYSLQEPVLNSGDLQLIDDWRRLQTSDHFYYMCTKWFSDGDVHAYFSPYDSPYEAFINYMNAYHDLHWRLANKNLIT
jgi:alpha-amylase